MTNYAVLISTKNITVDDDLHSSAWYDLILMYKTLKEKGFLPENIFILYGKGIDFDTYHFRYNSTHLFNRKITQWPANKTEIENIFLRLSTGAASVPTADGSLIDIPKIMSTDLIYVWWNGHGSQPVALSQNDDPCVTDFETVSGDIRDADLVQIINTVNTFSSRVLVFQTCASGGIINDFNSDQNSINNTVIMTSANCYQFSYNEFYDEKIFLFFWKRIAWQICGFLKKKYNYYEQIAHSPFNYHLASAIRGKSPDGTFLSTNPDSNNDNKVSIEECFKYVVDRLNDEAANFQSQYGHRLSTPKIDDNSGIATSLNLF